MSVLQRSPAPPRPVQEPENRLARRLSDERGIALVMAIAIMLVLTVLVTSTLAFTSSDSRDSSRGSGAQKAYAAAEAGINNALAAVQTANSDTSKMPTQLQPAVTQLPNGVTATWYGTYNATTKVWTLTSKSSVPNPTGPHASPLTRTITETASITPPPYTFVALNHEAGCPAHTLLVETSGQLTVTNAMYINSCNDGDAFDVFGAGGNIADTCQLLQPPCTDGITVVGAWETHDGSTVTVKGTTCPLGPKVLMSAPATPGCPVTGQPVLADPFGPGYGIAVSYSPAQTLSGTNMNNTQTTATSSGTAVKTGDVIQIDTEQMLVTAGGGTTTLTVQRAYNGTTAAAHNTGKAIMNVPLIKSPKVTAPTFGTTRCTGTAAAPAPCLYTSGTVPLQPGTYYGGICIGSLSTANCDGANCSTSGTTSAYNPALTENGAITSSSPTVGVKWGSGTDPVQVNDVIQINSELMQVNSIMPVTSTTATLGVTRGGTAAAHTDKTAVSKYTAPPHVSATMAAGTYIMAGGGFRVCGASTLSAPNVMIYNTQDPTSHAAGTAGAIDQIELNTTGTVTLGPQTSGTPYDGLTIFQDRSLAVDAAVDCNTRDNVTTPSQTQIDEYDIALVSTGGPGAYAVPGSSGALGSISGSLYAPANRTVFADEVSGTANLAVLTSCIVINGGNSTFAFDPKYLFGSGWAVGPQAG